MIKVEMLTEIHRKSKTAAGTDCGFNKYIQTIKKHLTKSADYSIII